MGSKMLWPNKNPPYTVFTDRNMESSTHPTLYADYRHLPFRPKVFTSVIFDPPHAARGGIHRGFNFQNPAAWSYYGWDITRRELIAGIAQASREIARITDRLCFKWSEVDYAEARICSLLAGEWERVMKLDIGESKIEKIPSYWITFIVKKDDREVKEIKEENQSWGGLTPTRPKHQTIKFY